jgi:ATP-dependent RNA helicase DeaD
MLQVAKIEVSWQPVPQPEKVQKALLKQARREMHERLAVEAPTETQLMYAKQLIEERDATHVIATLLEMVKTKPPREPMKVVGLDPFAEDRSKRRGGKSESRRDSQATSGAGGRPNGRRGARNDVDYTRFVVSWGEQTGATPSRILSHVCRRGGVESSQVGAIQISTKSSTVDIAREFAAGFETRTRRPDKRDPGITVRRDPSNATANSSARSTSGPTNVSRRPHAKSSGRPTHLKRKNSRRTASR